MSADLTDTLARALCVAGGSDPDEIVRVPNQGGGQIELPAWVKSRPRALLVVQALGQDLTPDGVAVLESALGIVRQAAKVVARG